MVHSSLSSDHGCDTCWVSLDQKCATVKYILFTGTKEEPTGVLFPILRNRAMEQSQLLIRTSDFVKKDLFNKEVIFLPFHTQLPMIYVFFPSVSNMLVRNAVKLAVLAYSISS